MRNKYERDANTYGEDLNDDAVQHLRDHSMDDAFVDPLLQRCGDVADRGIIECFEDESGGSPYDDHRFIRWLEQQAILKQTARERSTNACVAASFAVRMRRTIKLAHARASLPVAPLRAREAEVVGTIGEVARAAATVRCAPWLTNMAVAAGIGREMWDEPCEHWVELPRGVPRSGHVALNVAGDSMTPVLVAGDVLLVNVGTPPKEGSIIVARHPDDGYVVKYVGRVSANEIELESFNPAYAPFRIANDRSLVVGTVSYVLRQGLESSKR
jgi:SOS-response transcriptional repressor LexA